MSLEMQNQILLKYIEDQNLKEVILPEGIREIKEYAFCCCQNLEKITLPASLYRIESFAFYKCEKLSCIVMKNYIHHVSDIALKNCPDLQKIICFETEIPIGLVFRKGDAFHMIAERSFIYTPDENKMLIWYMFQANPEDMKIMLYIGKNFEEMFRILIEMHQPEILKKFLKTGKFLLEKNIDDFIQYANQKQRYEEQIILTEYKFDTYSIQDIADKLKL